MRFGLYYSQEIDWHEKNGGAYGDFEKNVAGMSWTNDWDFPIAADKDYSELFERKILPQVEELVNGYGDISLIWFDTPFVISEKQSRALYDLVTFYQPDCMINSRIGNEAGDYVSLGDNEIPEVSRGGKKVEAVVTLNDTWGYKAYDQNWKDASMVRALQEKLNRLNVNLLLNVGPDGLGRFPAAAVEIFKKVGK